MKLPKAFVKEMQKLWEEFSPPGTFAEFEKSFQEEASEALLLNSARCKGLSELPADYYDSLLYGVEQQEAGVLSPNALTEVPWSKFAYYLPRRHKMSKAVAYKQGLFYLQDPSAMLAAEIATSEPYAMVMDLCAAPGGKSFRLASSQMAPRLLLANELSDKRAKALLRNLDLAASVNVLVSCNDALNLPSTLQGNFDLLMADVPCTGSAMFRKDKRSLYSWARLRGEKLIDLQARILDKAADLVCPGGRIVYSTCSFSYDENEGQIANFCKRHPGFSICPTTREGADRALVDRNGEFATENALRIWPHRSRGEGQFVSMLCAPGEKILSEPKARIDDVFANISQVAAQAFRDFIDFNIKGGGSFLKTLQGGEYLLRENSGMLHLAPSFLPKSSGLRFLKTGALLGELKKEKDKLKFHPSQTFLLCLEMRDLLHYINLKQGLLLQKAARGETISLEDLRDALKREELLLCQEQEAEVLLQDIQNLATGRYVALAYEGRNLLWLKKQDDFLKNEYPKSWI